MDRETISASLRETRTTVDGHSPRRTAVPGGRVYENSETVVPPGPVARQRTEQTAYGDKGKGTRRRANIRGCRCGRKYQNRSSTWKVIPSTKEKGTRIKTQRGGEKAEEPKKLATCGSNGSIRAVQYRKPACKKKRKTLGGKNDGVERRSVSSLTSKAKNQLSCKGNRIRFRASRSSSGGKGREEPSR